MPTRELPAQVRAPVPPVRCLVVTPNGRRIRLEQALLDESWHTAPRELRVKLVQPDAERCVLNMKRTTARSRVIPRVRAGAGAHGAPVFSPARAA